jgi:hypothetical protein
MTWGLSDRLYALEKDSAGAEPVASGLVIATLVKAAFAVPTMR